MSYCAPIKLNKFSLSIICVVVLSLVICISAISCTGRKVTFTATYCFVCYKIADNSVSAGALSGTVSDYGGAGYVLTYNNCYYITVSCYYKKADAESVCATLKKGETVCTVLQINTDKFRVDNSVNTNAYLSILNNLDSLSRLAYECANGLDTGSVSQSNAKDVLRNIKTGLDGLSQSYPANRFTENLKELSAKCTELKKDFVYSKDMRFLQISIIDNIIKAYSY